MSFIRFTNNQSQNVRHRYIGDDLFRVWIDTLVRLDKRELNPVEIWCEAERLRRQLETIHEHREYEVQFFLSDLEERYVTFVENGVEVQRTESEATRTALIVLTILFSQLCDAGERDKNPHQAICASLAKILTTPCFNGYPEKLIQAFERKKHDYEGKKIVLPIKDYMQHGVCEDAMDELARGEVELLLNAVIINTQGIRPMCRIGWNGYKQIWRSICLDTKSYNLLKKIEPRKNSWNLNQKMVCNVIGLMTTFHLNNDKQNSTLVDDNKQHISDLLSTKNLRPYLSKYENVGTSDSAFDEEALALVKKIITDAIVCDSTNEKWYS